MKRLLIVVTLITTTLGVYRPAAAQGPPSGSWQMQNPSFPLVSLQTVACPTSTFCLAAGDATIFSTTDGGTTWHHRRVDKGSQIFRIVCTSASSCFALAWGAGAYNLLVVIQTRDGGHSWTDTSKLPKTTLGGATCATATTCYAVGGKGPGLKGPGAPSHLWRSDDAGGHWAPVKGQALYSVVAASLACPGPALCYLGGNGSLVVTRDGGRTWTRRSLAPAGSVPPTISWDWAVFSISCVAADTCYLVTPSGRIMETHDGWATARQLRRANSSMNASFNWIVCPAPSDCYVAMGFGSAILATTNGGASWKTLQTYSPTGVAAIACATVGMCAVVSYSTAIFTTHDAGASWHSGLPGTTNALTSISCADASTCTAVGSAGAILGTANGGKTWRLEPTANQHSLNAVSCPTATVCYAVGGSRSDLQNAGPLPLKLVGPVILGTRDGGSSWTLLAQKPIAGRPLNLAGIACPTAQICYATSDSGAILSTTDGGGTWRWSRTGAYFQLQGIACTTTDHCVAVGGLPAECPDSCFSPEEGAIFVTRDGGRTWQRRWYRQTTPNSPTATGALLNSIDCPSPTLCLAAGRNLLVTTGDGGQTWHLATKSLFRQQGQSPWRVQNIAVSCPSATTCWALYPMPTPSRTDDGGRTWTPGPAITHLRAGPLLALSCPTVDTCYAVGGSGLILRLVGAKSAADMSSRSDAHHR